MTGLRSSRLRDADMVLADQDLGFLRRESIRSPMHHTSLMELIPAARGAPPVTLDDLRGAIAERLHLVPMLRARLHSPPLGLGRYRWVEDPDFDIGNHVTAVGIPLMTDDDVAGFVSDMVSERLDRARPLWRFQLLPALPDERQFVLFSVHHALADGIYTVHIFEQLLGREPTELQEAARPAGAPPAYVVARELLGAVAAGLRARGQRLLRGQPSSGRSPTAVDPAVEDARSLSGPVGRGRAVELRDVSLGDLRWVKQSHGVTTNDVYVALVAAGLRRLLLHRGEPVESWNPTAMVPRNVRSADDANIPGTRTWSMFVPLPVGEPDPGDRLRRINTSTTEGKRKAQSEGTRSFTWDITVTTARVGSLAVAGREVRAVWSAVPLQGNNRLAVAGILNPERFTLSFTADQDAFPDLSVLADGTLDGLMELLEQSERPR